MFKIFFILLLFFSSAFSMTAVTVTYPIEAFFLKKIADKTVYIRVIEQSATKFNLDNLEETKKFATSHYYFNFGLDEEKTIEDYFKKRNPNLKVFNMSESLLFLKLKNGKFNPYIWLDPISARDIAKNIYEAIIKIRPYDKDIYKVNYENFLNELDETYLDIKKRLDESELYGIFSFNNELDYFTNRFRINNYHREYRMLHIDEVSSLLKFVRKENIKHILISNEADFRVAQSFKGYIDGKIIEYNIYTRHWKVNLYTILRGIENF
ncbi:metal ABC transporter solute-binding protein, Zn/Mn family [Halarcobacter sp.]|uniref:metal ABC transporter solute-binding protein, Zn/Mn family n=1 Tax=Halarcobacter sp. TaxID=2321133 RepID=UPI002AA773F9|nr:zinc ABC transporter substrate-binding protein [Halarcobacter sp.]